MSFSLIHLFSSQKLFCLFDLILYSPVNNFSVMSGLVFLGLTGTKQRLMCLAQGSNAVMPVRLKPATPQSRVKHSTTEPLCSRHSQKLWVFLQFIGLSHRSVFFFLQFIGSSNKSNVAFLFNTLVHLTEGMGLFFNLLINLIENLGYFSSIPLFISQKLLISLQLICSFHRSYGVFFNSFVHLTEVMVFP